MDNSQQRKRSIITWIILVTMFVAVYMFFTGGPSKSVTKMTFNQFKSAVERQEVKSIIINSDGSAITGELVAGGKYKTTKERGSSYVTDY